MYITVPRKISKHFFLLILTLWSAINLLSQPVADFSATLVNGCAPLIVTFKDLSTGNPTQWKWDLGNGTISNGPTPSATYFNPGKYTITLTVTNSSGTNTVVKNQFINVYKAPVVNFSGSPFTGCLPLPVQLTDKSLPGDGTLSTWKWDFGDGVINSVQNPQHIYTTAGTFDVTLQVKNSFGCVSAASKPKYVKTEKVTADFDNNTQGSCKPPVNLDFKNLSAGSSLTYKWDFGDKVKSSAANPSHKYSVAGKYLVQLIATSSSGCSETITKEIVIGTVSSDFSSPAAVCPGKAFSIINKSEPLPGSAKWYFGDGTTLDTISPIKIYANPGVYTIKMVADFGACLDSVSKKITVLPKTNIAFNASDTTSCKAPFIVNFTSSVSGTTSLLWDFGDSTISTDLNPSHTYDSLGNYTVTLIATNNSGCEDTLKKPGFIKIQSPAITLPDLPLKDCTPFTHTFSSSLTSYDSIASYLWDFGDNTTANTPKPAHTFSKVGRYDISLNVITLSGCTATAKVIKGVQVGLKPAADFKAAPLSACASTPITFTDLSTGNVDEWLWNFGDKKSSGSKNPTHLYFDTGFFNITLVARSSGCPSEKTISKYVYIKPSVSKFAVINNCKKPFEKIFSDSSKGADSWEWDFGDGKTSNVASPVHAYTDTGTYNVSLKVTNFSTGCQHTSTQIVYVIIQKAQFRASDTDICRGTSVFFQGENINNSKIINFRWSFYDGGFISSRFDTATYIYAQSGTYDTRLIITDLLGCRDTLVKQNFIKVQGPVAAFKANATGGCINTPINFTDNSLDDGTYPITQWKWNYGDSITETLKTPPFKHAYSQPGFYSVSLNVVDKNGCTDSIINGAYIDISKPLADFTTTDTASCPFKPINFTTLSTGSNLTYLWYFGDGNTSIISDPVHQYSAIGSYTVSLKIIDKNGCTDSIGKKNYVAITYPKADFTLSDSITACPPFFVTFNNNSLNYDSVQWDFGDGNLSEVITPTHFYYIPGTYTVKLRVTGPGGCYDEKTGTIIVRGPNGVLNYTNIAGCNPLQTNFTATAKDNLLFIWDFNDGTTVKTSNFSISHTYTNAGIYLPKLILEDVNGCQVPISGTDTIKVFEAKAAFNILDKIICNSGVVDFSDSSFSNDTITKYLWNFGDGSTSNNQNPAHNYTAPGQYTVGLVITTSVGCKDTLTKVASARIVASPDISISRRGKGCVLDTLNFNGILLKPDTSIITWKWNFGNGQTSAQQIAPPQVYSSPGNFIVTAIAANSSGCRDTANLPVTVSDLPDINAGNDVLICQGKSLRLQASGGLSYQWVQPSFFLSCTNCSNPVTNTPDDITYIVKGTNEAGCVSLDSVSVKVKKPFKISISPIADSICIGQATHLNASYAEKYLWSPSSGLSNSTIRNPQVSPQTTTTYKVVGYDSINCFKDSAYAKVTVFKYPEINAGSDKTISTGASVNIIPTYSNDVVSWLWTPAAGLNCNYCSSPVASPKATIIYTLEVKNDGNCAASDNVTVFVNCNNLNVFVPNTFSPNGDGANDIFYPRGTGIDRVRGMKIFNRWGQVLFERSNFYANDPAAGWDGRSGGIKLAPDVYTFIIDVICDNGNILTQTGTITLIR